MNTKQIVTEHLQTKLIPFWEALKDEQFGGYYGYMDYDLKVDKDYWKGCILNSRILWFFSRAYMTLHDPKLLADAKQAYDFVDRFFDKENGGVYWSVTHDGQPLDTMKHTYAESFCIYGLSAYAMASGEQAPLDKAMSLYETIETKMTDEIGYCEAFDRTFHPLDNGKLSDNPKLLAKGKVAEKTMNTILHVMEAYTLLYQAGHNERVRASLLTLLKVVQEKVYNAQDNRLEVFFDCEMNTLIDMQSYGHDIEATWLLDFAADTVLTGDELAAYKAWTTKLAWGVYDRSYRDDSLLNEWVEGEVDSKRIWWVQAETAVGMTNLYQKTRDPRALEAVDKTVGYIMRTIVDPREGSEWYWAVDENGKPYEKPIVEPWKCPYHNGRMCMELIARL